MPFQHNFFKTGELIQLHAEWGKLYFSPYIAKQDICCLCWKYTSNHFQTVILLQNIKQNQIQMSGFHIPANQYEKERIQKNTGEIRQWKNDFIDRVFVRGRTFPGIEVTRQFIIYSLMTKNQKEYYDANKNQKRSYLFFSYWGDYFLIYNSCFGNDIAKMIGVTNEPDIYYHEISKQNDAFLLLTTPNFFDYISYEEVYQILNSFNQKTVKKAQELLQKRIKNLYSQEIEVINDLAFIVYYFF